jgi:hypothetical protein
LKEDEEEANKLFGETVEFTVVEGERDDEELSCRGERRLKDFERGLRFRLFRAEEEEEEEEVDEPDRVSEELGSAEKFKGEGEEELVFLDA